LNEKNRAKVLLGVVLVAAILAFATLAVVPQLSFAKKHRSHTSSVNSPSSQATGTNSASDTFGEGVAAGKSQGKTDAINGADNSSCDVTIHSNSYCAGYHIGYRANHAITNLVR